MAKPMYIPNHTLRTIAIQKKLAEAMAHGPSLPEMWLTNRLSGITVFVSPFSEGITIDFAKKFVNGVSLEHDGRMKVFVDRDNAPIVTAPTVDPIVPRRSRRISNG